MKLRRVTTCLAVGLMTVGMTMLAAQQNQKPTVEIPKPGVPQIMTIEGEYVRVAYNNEGFVTLGYRIVNESVGQEWAMLAPNACGEWLREQPFGPDMDPAIDFFSQIIVRDDGESAVQWASRISDPARREQLLQIVLEEWSVRDPAAAAAANHSLPVPQ